MMITQMCDYTETPPPLLLPTPSFISSAGFKSKMNLSVTGWIPPQEKQAGNGEEPKRELGQLEGNRTQPLRILPVCRCCSKTKQWPPLCVRCRDRKPAAFYFAYVAFILKPCRSTPAGGDGRRGPAQKGKRKERLAMIFFFFFWCESARQSACPP